MNKRGLAILLFSAPMAAYAQDGGGGGEMSIFSMVIGHAGFAGWTTLVMSVVAFTLAIKLILDTRRDKVLPASVEQHVADLLQEEDFEGALNSVSGDPSFLGRVLFGGLSKLNGGQELVIKGQDEAWETEQNSFMQLASYVQLIAQLAPMMGLFGTVYGMMNAFSVLATSEGAANPKDLAQGIMFALVTTFIGLLVAIPCNVLYLLIRNKVVSIGLEVNTRASDILDMVFADEEEE